jgi:hypothetical protein
MWPGSALRFHACGLLVFIRFSDDRRFAAYFHVVLLLVVIIVVVVRVSRRHRIDEGGEPK